MSEVYIKTVVEPDFGCEGAPDNKPICDRITFALDDGEITMEIPERVVWDTKIDEGMYISGELFEKLKENSVR